MGLCWCVGFGSEDVMLRAAASAAFVLTVSLGLRVCFRFLLGIYPATLILLT